LPLIDPSLGIGSGDRVKEDPPTPLDLARVLSASEVKARAALSEVSVSLVERVLEVAFLLFKLILIVYDSLLG